MLNWCIGLNSLQGILKKNNFCLDWVVYMVWFNSTALNACLTVHHALWGPYGGLSGIWHYCMCIMRWDTVTSQFANIYVLHYFIHFHILLLRDEWGCIVNIISVSGHGRSLSGRSSAWHSFERCTSGKGLLGFISNIALPMLVSCFETYTNFLNSSQNMVANQIIGNRDNHFFSVIYLDWQVNRHKFLRPNCNLLSTLLSQSSCKSSKFAENIESLHSFLNESFNHKSNHKASKVCAHCTFHVCFKC